MVSTSILAQAVRYLTHIKANLPEIFLECDLDPAIMNEPDSRIPFAQYIMFEEAAAKKVRDPCFGLHTGEFAEPGNFSILGYMMMNSPTLGQAMAKAEKYYKILGTLFTPKARPGLGTVKVRYTVPADAPEISYHCYDSLLASLVTLARKLTGLPLNPRETGFSRPEPPEAPEYSRVFQSPVLFNQKSNYLILDLSMGRTPVLQPNPKLFAYFENYAAESLQKLENQNPVTRETARLITLNLGYEKLKIGTIAKNQAMSVRTLQNRLEAEGTVYKNLVSEVREKLAKRYLAEGYTIEEISLRLGYADTGSFSKAFKTWTNLTPAEYRRNQKSNKNDRSIDP